MFTKAVCFGKYGQWVAALTATTSLLVSAQICTWPTGALPKMIDGSAGFTPTDFQMSLIASLPNIGAVISPIPCGYVIDILGRKRTLSFALLFVIASWVVLIFSKNIIVVCLARLLMGMWNGSEYSTVSIYIAEVVEPSARGSLISITSMMFNLGALYVSFISFTDYETMTLLCLVTPILLSIAFLFIPESPYYYLMRGKRKEAEEAITWLRGECHAEELDAVEAVLKEQMEKKATFGEIFNNRSNCKGFFLIECFKICSGCSATLLLVPYSTQLIPYGWISPQESQIVLCIVWVCAALIASVLLYRFKRKTMMRISTLGAIITLTITAAWYYLRETSAAVSSTAYLPLILLVTVSLFETIGITSVPNILKGELFPMNIKTKASALSCMTACGCESLNYLLFYYINDNIGVYFNFVKSAISAALALFITQFFLIETKGQSLENIQILLNARKSKKTEPIAVDPRVGEDA